MGESEKNTGMRRALVIAAALARRPEVPAANAQKLDANGKRRGLDGKFAKAEVCAKVKPLAFTKRGDAKGKFVKRDAPGAKRSA